MLQNSNRLLQSVMVATETGVRPDHAAVLVFPQPPVRTVPARSFTVERQVPTTDPARRYCGETPPGEATVGGCFDFDVLQPAFAQ